MWARFCIPCTRGNPSGRRDKNRRRSSTENDKESSRPLTAVPDEQPCVKAPSVAPMNQQQLVDSTKITPIGGLAKIEEADCPPETQCVTFDVVSESPRITASGQQISPNLAQTGYSPKEKASFDSSASSSSIDMLTNHRTSHPHHQHTPFFFPTRSPTDPTSDLSHRGMGDSNNRVVKPIPVRRGSMIVRSGRTSSHTPGTLTDVSALSSTGPSPSTGQMTSSGEGFIVTPFAQVLVSLQRIRNAFMRLTAAKSSQKFAVSSAALPEPSPTDVLSFEHPNYPSVASETLEELEWCLKQLETIQTKRPVSDMAFSKFKRLLNKELSNFSESDKARSEISAYIVGTYMDDEKDAETNQEIEQMMEIRRNSGQSHTTTTGAREGSPTVQQQASAGAPAGSAGSLQEKKGPANVSLPRHGIATHNDDLLDKHFAEKIDAWGLDVFEIDRLSNGHALTTIAFRLFESRDLIKTFSIDPSTLVRYLLRIESMYNSNVPYHNSLHAADVMQTSHHLLQAEPLKDVFSELEVLAVLFASIIHDADHPGLTNQYLVNTSHELALQYNDSSVLENHHIYIGYKVLNEAGLDFLSALGAKKRQALRRMIIDLVLATDMSKHMSLLADLRTMVETKKVSGSGDLNLDNYADRLQILQNMIHCADLSNPAKPLPLYRIWTTRLIEEFFRQGDKERSLGIEISPMCDRESVAVEKTQVTFIEFVAHPLWETWCDLVHPAAQQILDTLEENREWYEERVEELKQKSLLKAKQPSIVYVTRKPRLAPAEENDEEISSNDDEAKEKTKVIPKGYKK